MSRRHPAVIVRRLTALLLLRGYLTIRSHEHILSIEVEHVSLARHLFSLLKAAGAGSPEVLRKQVRRLGIQRYQVQVTGQENIAVLLQSLGLKRSDLPRCLVREPSLVPSQRCCRRAFIRGHFWPGGSLNTPTGAGLSSRDKLRLAGGWPTWFRAVWRSFQSALL